MLIGESRPHSPHEQHQPAQTPLAAQNVRRRRTVPLTGPIALLATGCLIAIGVIAGVIGSWTTGAIEAAQFREDLMLVSCTVGALVTFAGIGWWQDRRAVTRHEEARGWAEAHDRLMIEQYTALARRVVGLELLVEEYGAKAVADATRIATQYVGVLTHRVEQVEALVEQAGKGGAVGKAVAGDIGAIRAEIQVLRRDHDELSEEVGRSKVARLRSAAPPDGR